jgi:hypothetical protein
MKLKSSLSNLNYKSKNEDGMNMENEMQQMQKLKNASCN